MDDNTFAKVHSWDGRMENVSLNVDGRTYSQICQVCIDLVEELLKARMATARLAKKENSK